MSLAKSWDQFFDINESGTSCLGPLACPDKQRAIYEVTVNTQSDAGNQSLTGIEKQGNDVIMTMCKGGLGKTTVATAIAAMLAKRDQSVHLNTTDPGAHAAKVLAGQVDGLTLSKIDSAAENVAYQKEAITAQGAAIDLAGRSLLEKDLRLPCNEEIGGFRAFAREVGQGTGRFVVLDTAPTGPDALLHLAEIGYQPALS